MSTPTVAQPRSGDLGEPQRKFYVTPREIPVPVPVPLEEPRTPAEEPVRELEPVAC